MTETIRPSAIDLFSGFGGASLGIGSAGFRVLAGIELAVAPAEVFQLNHPEARLYNNDIRDLDPSEIMVELGLDFNELDLMIGCSPCQGFSRIRTRNRPNSADDPRNDLVLDFARFVEEMLPKVVVFENVPGIRNDSRYDTMIERLEEAGYSVVSGVLDLSRFGVPQRRKRLIIIGSQLGQLGMPKFAGKIRTVRETIGRLVSPENSRDPLHRSITVHSEAIRNKIAKIPTDGGSRTDLAEEDQLPCHTRTDGFRDVYGRMSWDKPSPTITRFSYNPSKGRYLHPSENRAISLREAAMLQSIPRRYKLPLDKYGRVAIASMIGEALPPLFAKRLGGHIYRHLAQAKS